MGIGPKRSFDLTVPIDHWSGFLRQQFEIPLSYCSHESVERQVERHICCIFEVVENVLLSKLKHAANSVQILEAKIARTFVFVRSSVKHNNRPK